MKTYTYFIGNDIGKSTVAVCVLDAQEKLLLQLSIPNTKGGMETLAKRLEKLPHFKLENALFCLEHTGLYCQPMLSYFYPRSADIWLDSAVRIKHSLGIKRTKTDKADAYAIAKYCLRNQADKQLFTLTDNSLQRIRQLAQQRQRLMNMAKELTDLSQDYTAMGLTTELSLHRQSSDEVLKILGKKIKDIEHQIGLEIKESDALKTNLKLLMSIPGVGKQTALFMLIFTGNFTRFASAKKLASYAGVAPFAYESGTSIRGRTKVNHMANTKLKWLLHMASMGAVKVKGEMRSYYERKVASGKNKMSVLNAVRNKLVHRMMAVIERQTVYQPVWEKIV